MASRPCCSCPKQGEKASNLNLRKPSWKKSNMIWMQNVYRRALISNASFSNNKLKWCGQYKNNNSSSSRNSWHHSNWSWGSNRQTKALMSLFSKYSKIHQYYWYNCRLFLTVQLLSLRYRWTPKYLPSTCPWGNRFDVDHAMSYMKGGFVHRNVHFLMSEFLTRLQRDTLTRKLTRLSRAMRTRITDTTTSELFKSSMAPSALSCSHHMVETVKKPSDFLQN